MKRTTIGATTVALLAVATGITHWAQSPAEAATTATVRVTSTAPLTVRGVGFAPGERVKLSVSVGDRNVRRTLTRSVVATRAGTFRAQFSAMHYMRCHGPLSVRAAGRAGTRVSLGLAERVCTTSPES
jgi:hypothetical protein